MKHLKTYQLFESFETNMDSYTKLAKEICYELEDEGYNVDVKSELEVPSWAKDYIQKGYVVNHKERIVDITISKKGWFVYNDVNETCERLIDALGDSKNWSGGLFQPLKLEDSQTSHYWQSSRDKGELMILFPTSSAMWVKKVNRDVIPSGSYLGLSSRRSGVSTRQNDLTEKDCLKSEVVLKFS